MTRLFWLGEAPTRVHQTAETAAREPDEQEPDVEQRVHARVHARQDHPGDQGAGLGGAGQAGESSQACITIILLKWNLKKGILKDE